MTNLPQTFKNIYLMKLLVVTYIFSILNIQQSLPMHKIILQQKFQACMFSSDGLGNWTFGHNEPPEKWVYLSSWTRLFDKFLSYLRIFQRFTVTSVCSTLKNHQLCAKNEEKVFSNLPQTHFSQKHFQNFKYMFSFGYLANPIARNNISETHSLPEFLIQFKCRSIVIHSRHLLVHVFAFSTTGSIKGRVLGCCAGGWDVQVGG